MKLADGSDEARIFGHTDRAKVADRCDDKANRSQCHRGQVMAEWFAFAGPICDRAPWETLGGARKVNWIIDLRRNETRRGELWPSESAVVTITFLTCKSFKRPIKSIHPPPTIRSPRIERGWLPRPSEYRYCVRIRNRCRRMLNNYATGTDCADACAAEFGSNSKIHYCLQRLKHCAGR